MSAQKAALHMLLMIYLSVLLMVVGGPGATSEQWFKSRILQTFLPTPAVTYISTLKMGKRDTYAFI